MNVRDRLRRGLVIPAHPLALNASRKLDERRQRALTRYYLASGAGGIAVGVHTTQFEIRDPEVCLLKPVMRLAAEEASQNDVIKIAGVCGKLPQALAEANLALDSGYEVALLSLAGLQEGSITALLNHASTIAD